MSLLISLALALAIDSADPPASRVVDALNARAFVLRDLKLEDGQGGGALSGWLCRRGPGTPLRHLSVSAETAEGRSVWSRDIAAPSFDPGRRPQCRVLKIDLPREATERARTWTIR